MFESLPPCFEEARVDDAARAGAYERLSDQARSRLKTSMAITTSVWGEQRVPRQVVTESPWSGYRIARSERPADWAVFLIGPATPPALLCAALTCCRLAGVGEVAAILAGKPVHDGVLVSLDLCGIEPVFLMNDSQAATFIDYAETLGAGRIIISGASSVLAARAFRYGHRCYDLDTAVTASLDETLAGCDILADLSPGFFLDLSIDVSQL